MSEQNNATNELESAKFAVILKQIAQEFDLEIVHPGDPKHTFLLFSGKNPGTYEMQQRINARIAELEKQA